MRIDVLSATLCAILAVTARAETAPPAVAPGPGAAPEAGAADPEAQARKAAEIKAAFGRELKGELRKFPFEAPGGIKGSAEAKAAPTVKAEGPELVIDIGTQQPVSCTIFAQRIDAGASTSRMAAAIAKEMKLLGAQPVAVAAVAGSALVFSEMVYQTATEKGPMLGHFKLAVYAHDGHSLLCNHDEPGYSKSFQRVVGSLAASLEGGGQDERAGSRYAEISVMRIGDVPIGYAEMVLWDREGGGSVESQYETQILPRSQTDLVAVDAYRQEAADADGLLVSGTYVHLTNGEIDSKMTLAKGKAPGSFRYEGEKQGKKLAGTFRTKAGLATDLWFARRFDAKAGYGPKGEVKHEGYVSSANPVAASLISYRKDAAQPRRAEMTVGPLRAAGELDENGLFKSMEVPVGPTKIAVERVWSRGAP